MSRPFLPAPPDWRRGTLEPTKDGLIQRVSSGGTPSTGVDEYWDGDVLWLTPKELARGSVGLYVTDTERKITDEGVRGSAAKLLPAGTVLLSKRAPVGLVGIAAVPLSTNQGFLNFHCGVDLIPEYFAYWLVANRPYLDAIAIGSTYPELYKGDLFEFEIAVPGLSEQRATVDFMKNFDFLVQIGSPLENLADITEIRDVQRQTKRLGNLRLQLLRGLLSGRICATDLPGLSSGEGFGGCVVPSERVSA